MFYTEKRTEENKRRLRRDVFKMLLTMLPSAFAVSFADTRGYWAEDEIKRWSDRGVI